MSDEALKQVVARTMNPIWAHLENEAIKAFPELEMPLSKNVDRIRHMMDDNIVIMLKDCYKPKPEPFWKD